MNSGWDIGPTERAAAARFEAVMTEGGAKGRVSPRTPRWAGIIGFATRRALVRLESPTFPGLPWRRHPARTIYQLCDGGSIAGAIANSGWMPVGRMVPDGPLREPYPLRFLDFLPAGTVEDEQTVGEDDVRGVHTRHVALTLDLDRSVWPQPNPIGPPRGALQPAWPLMAKLIFMDPEPYGRLPVEAWIDADGRLRRVGWTVTRAQHKNIVAAWTMTELWGYGEPAAIADTLSQPVIDPVTMQPITEES